MSQATPMMYGAQLEPPRRVIPRALSPSRPHLSGQGFLDARSRVGGTFIRSPLRMMFTSNRSRSRIILHHWRDGFEAALPDEIPRHEEHDISGPAFGGEALGPFIASKLLSFGSGDPLVSLSPRLSRSPLFQEPSALTRFFDLRSLHRPLEHWKKKTFDRPTFNRPTVDLPRHLLDNTRPWSQIAMATDTSTPRSYGTVLVVGGCGFLGSRVVDQLLNFPSEDADADADPDTPELRHRASSKPAETKGSGPTSTSYTPTKFDVHALLPSSFPSLRSRYPPTSSTTTQVHVLDLRCTTNVFPGATYHSGDITSPDALLEIFRAVKPDLVINTASPSWEAPAAVLRKVNIDGTRILLEVAGGKHGDWGGRCRAFVHTSSASVVHDGESDLINADERYPYVCPNPREYYSETKVYAEKLALEANDKDEYGHMLTCAVRPAGIVGEGDRGGFSAGILRTASVAPDWQLHIQLGQNANLFDNTYVHNVVYGLLCAAQALLATSQRKSDGKAPVLDHEKVDGEAFNVTNDSPAFFWDSSRYLFSRYGRDIRIENVRVLPVGFATWVGAAAETFNWMTGRKGKLNRQTVKYACVHRYYSCDKLKRRTGYQPLVGVEEGLARSVRWFKADEEAQKKKNKKAEGEGEKKGP